MGYLYCLRNIGKKLDNWGNIDKNLITWENWEEYTDFRLQTNFFSSILLLALNNEQIN
jgi:hypothetical protein